MPHSTMGTDSISLSSVWLAVFGGRTQTRHLDPGTLANHADGFQLSGKFESQKPCEKTHRFIISGL